MQKFKETRDSKYMYQNELVKACFQQDMADKEYKDLSLRTGSDKVLCSKHLILLKIEIMTDIHVKLLRWFTIFFYKKSSGGAARSPNKYCY